MNILNYFFVACIIFAFVFYFYYKTKQFRTTLPIRKKWYKAKSGVALGVFMIFFGCNATIIYPTGVGFSVAAVFVIIGAGLAINNYKRVQHEGKYIKEEYELNK